MTGPEPLEDLVAPAEVRSRETVFRGRIWDVHRDVVALPTGDVVRDYVAHTGAVAVLALDAQDRVLVLRQYRHPIGMHEWELPAGLLDVEGEDPLECARRELWEEVDLVAEHWEHALTWHSSPGAMSEAIHLYVARGLSHAPEEERHARTDEEAGMPTRWVGADELREAALSGRIGNATLVIAALALDDLRARRGAASTGQP